MSQDENHELREKNAHILTKARAYRQQAKGLVTNDAEDVEEEMVPAAPKQKSTQKALTAETVAKKPRKERAASVESDVRSDSEPPVAAPKEKVSHS